MTTLEILFGIGFSVLSIDRLVHYVKSRKSTNSVGGDGDHNVNVMSNSNNTTHNTSGLTKPVIIISNNISLSNGAIEILHQFLVCSSRFPNGFSLSPSSPKEILEFRELEAHGFIHQIQGTQGTPLKFEVDPIGLVEANKYVPFEKYQETRKSLEAYFQQAVLVNKNQGTDCKKCLINSSVEMNQFTDRILQNMDGENLLEWKGEFEGKYPLVELKSWYKERLLSAH
jgi:hypothetical protein